MHVDIDAPNANDSLSLTELRLYREIMAYRADLGLGAIPLSKALTTTAGRHAADTYGNVWAEDRPLEPGTNLHSWSDAPYLADHSRAQVMWDAPARLGTGYPGRGYEISAAGQGDVTAALNTWRGSAPHNAVLAELGGWAGVGLRTIGIGVLQGSPTESFQGRIYHVWFGDAADPGVPDIRGTAAGDRFAGTAAGDRFAGTAFGDRLWGLGGDDRIAGGAGDDRIAGGRGRDVLSGGGGADAFVFAGGPRDRILDFDPREDTIVLDRGVFRALGPSLGQAEWRAAGGARDRTDNLIYDRAEGRLAYDANGSARGGVTLVALLDPGTRLTMADIDIL